MKLLVAIPALNEEESIAPTVQRTLDAAVNLRAHTRVTEVAVTVVSDGSNDRTVERARAFGDAIELVVFEVNRGYGAAIQEAWRRSDAELLAFLDADGTCDPEFFVPLVQALDREQADVALGCRMTPASRMPPLRAFGNRLFAWMLAFASSKRVRDTASGMRVVRRASLPLLLPLPNGLHFTPAMSARALLSDAVRIVEVDMPYHERTGRSKLSVLRDGLRFLRVIGEAAFLYRPSRPLGLLGLAFGVLGAALMVMPTLFYVQHGRVEEWMIYRFVVSHLLGTGALSLLGAAYLAGRMAHLTVSAARPTGGVWRAAEAFLRSRSFFLVPLVLVGAGAALVTRSLLELTLTGATYEHWSRFVVMSLLWGWALILTVTRLCDWVLTLIAERLRYLAGEEPP